MEKQILSLFEIGDMMKEVIRAFRSHSESDQLFDINISPEQFGILHAIKTQQNDVIQKDLSDMMKKHKTVILRIIDSLEEKELVRRVHDKKDRRKNYLLLTKNGERVIGYYLKLTDELMIRLQEGLTDAEIQTFHKVVHHIKTRAENL